MKVYLRVNKATFQRVISGEQDEVYVRFDERWTRKLLQYGSMRYRTVQTITLACGVGEPDRLIKAECLRVGSKSANPLWWPREEVVYYFKLGKRYVVLPPFPRTEFKMSVRNRIK